MKTPSWYVTPLCLLVFLLSGCQRQTAVEDSSTVDSAQLQARLQKLSRQIDAVEAVRDVRRLQWAYGHYSEVGLWYDFADLFADSGVGHYVQGDLKRDAIRDLFFEQVGQGQLGLADGRIYPHISFAPVVTLSDDGLHANGRYRLLAMLGGYGGNATWFHGVYENGYVKERGVWKHNEVSFTAEASGSFTNGLASQAKGPLDEPTIAFHYMPDQVGRIFTPATEASADQDAASSDLPRLASEFISLQQRLAKLSDEAAILNLQHQFGYALDRHDWDTLAGYFAAQGTLELGQRGVYAGRASIRHALGQFGEGLAAGDVDDHLEFQTYVSVSPDGMLAKARVDQLGMQGRRGVSAEWTQGIYENTFVKQAGQWRIQAVHYYPRLITDYAKGWASDAQPAAGLNPDYPPDAPPTETYRIYPAFYIPALHFMHPVTGRAPQYPLGVPAAGMPVGFAETPSQTATPVVPDPAVLQEQLATAELEVVRQQARDAVENLVNAYTFYLDECRTQDAASLFAAMGENEIPGVGVYAGKDRIAESLHRAWCPQGRREGELTLHHVAQPVITIEAAGNTAHVITRLWQVHATGQDDDYYLAGMLTGDAVRVGNGWKLSSLKTAYDWAAALPEGWAFATKNAGLGYAAPEDMAAGYPPDAPSTTPRLAPNR